MPTTTWFDQDDRVRAPEDRLAAVPDSVVDAELALLTISSDVVWRETSRRGRSTMWHGYTITCEPGRVELYDVNRWLASSNVLSTTETKRQRAALAWGIRAVLALKSRQLLTDDVARCELQSAIDLAKDALATMEREQAGTQTNLEVVARVQEYLKAASEAWMRWRSRSLADLPERRSR